MPIFLGGGPYVELCCTLFPLNTVDTIDEPFDRGVVRVRPGHVRVAGSQHDIAVKGRPQEGCVSRRLRVVQPTLGLCLCDYTDEGAESQLALCDDLASRLEDLVDAI
jgi:hypothetical protein